MLCDHTLLNQFSKSTASSLFQSGSPGILSHKSRWM